MDESKSEANSRPSPRRKGSRDSVSRKATLVKQSDSKAGDDKDDESKSAPAFSSSIATKKKISSLLGTFEPFEVEMLSSTRQRRVKDEQELERLRGEMVALGKTMNSETAKRTDTARQLQTWSGERVSSLRDRLLQTLHSRMDGLDVDITGIHERIASLEAELAHEKETIPADIERRSAELTAQLTAFQEQFEEECLSRLEREKAITQRVTEHEVQMDKECGQEPRERQPKYIEIKTALERSVNQRKNRVERFHGFVEREIDQLKDAIARETVIREKEDDEIVQTLTKYTEKLQKSLRVINTANV